MLRQIVQNAARCADCCAPVFQAEAIEGGDLEMFAHGVERGFGREGPVIVAAENLERAAEEFAEFDGLGGENDFGGTEAFEFRKQKYGF